MISGASQADVAVLVVSARKGEFESGFEKDGQTIEHAQLAKTLGIKKIVVAINKMDDKSVEWDIERYNDIVSKLTKFFTSIGYNPKKSLKIFFFLQFPRCHLFTTFWIIWN
jgi:peptide chain release factor subunit 3